jgi:hypothetical protein
MVAQWNVPKYVKIREKQIFIEAATRSPEYNIFFSDYLIFLPFVG